MLLRTLAQFIRRLQPARSTARDDSFLLAYRLYQEGRLDDAEVACRDLSGLASADVHFLRGLIAYRRRHYESAVAAFELAVEARDGEPSFHYSLAEALVELARHERASRHAERFLHLADQTDPRRTNAWMMLFAWRTQAGDTSGADECAAHAIKESAQNPSALVSIADGYWVEGRTDIARDVFSRRLKWSDSYAIRLRRAATLPQVYESQAEIREIRDRFSRDLDELLSIPSSPTSSPQSEVGILPFYLAYHNENNAEILRKYCSAARRAFTSRTAVRRPGHSSGRIRIGFVSTYFYNHSVGRTTIGLIRDLPRPRFDVHVFAIEPATDPMAAGIAAAADDYHRVPNDLEIITQAISAADLDVLVFADIGMHPTTYFLALNRLAPLQITTWGHSETSGIDTIDYYLSADGVECDSAQSHYSETLLRPKAFFLPGYGGPGSVPPAAVESLGLTRGVRRYACLQPEFKLHPDMDDVFKGILEGDPQGEILLLTTRMSWTSLLKNRFQRSLGRLVQRVRFIPRMRHDQFLGMLVASDVCLDPLYFGGCNSSCEAMAFGKPIVTLPGNHLHGRFTAALYEELGIRGCIADTVADYIERALAIAQNRDAQEVMAREVRSRSALLFERKDITLALARFLEQKVAEA